MKKRLRKEEKDLIVKKLRDLGYRPGVQANGIYLWDKDVYIGSYTWVKKVGWRLSIAHPTIYTHDDLEPTFDEIKVVQKYRQDIAGAWEKYKASPSEKNWQTYQGLLASFYMRQIQPTGDSDGSSQS